MHLGESDGRNTSAQIILAILNHSALAESWDSPTKRIEVAHWDNGRERGYSLKHRNFKGLDFFIVFYEYRSGGAICVMEFEAVLINPPTIDNTRGLEAVNTSFTEFAYHEAADYIESRLVAKGA
jgi:hypothetical protein